ncbi:sigma-70 family RNA polymerase sigma factor [Stieleria sedimenti]|uniref:sigma-70 family RNA polymerase sigma factor n=1 Tax=Stieleria sedimenti TaxID=2976331 RepID=UPI00217FECCA|nr:sigma-70 family RNA polymerase sigma factor [Stieleria sedimenti]
MILLAADSTSPSTSSSPQIQQQTRDPHRRSVESSMGRRSRRRDNGLNRFIFIDAFTEPNADLTLLAPMPDSDQTAEQKPPANLPVYLARLWTIPLLSRAQEHHGFRKLNYLKYLLSELENEIQSCRGCDEMLRTRDTLIERILETRGLLIESNLRLVVSLAKKYASPLSDHFDELVCVGNAALVDAVDRFDFRRGFRFSTYSYTVIQRSLFDTHHRDQRFRAVSMSESLDSVDPIADDSDPSDLASLEASEFRKQLLGLMDELDDRDKHIVMSRLGFNRTNKGLAFRAIAEGLGISTTRTAQLFHRSVEKMRASAIERNVNFWMEGAVEKGRSGP